MWDKPVATQSHPDGFGMASGCPMAVRTPLVQHRMVTGQQSGWPQDSKFAVPTPPGWIWAVPTPSGLLRAIPKPSGWFWDVGLPNVSGLLWDGQLLSQCHPDGLGLANLLSQGQLVGFGLSQEHPDGFGLSRSHPDGFGTANVTAQSHPDAHQTACHTFGKAVDGHGNADGYGQDNLRDATGPGG